MASASAGPVVSTGGFEDRPTGPDFVLGDLAGQNGWLLTPSSTSTATVTSLTGGQAVEIEAYEVDRRWAMLPSGTLPGSRYINISWDMAVNVTQAEGFFGPFLGVEAYSPESRFPATPSLLGSLGVDATTGDVLIQAWDSGALTETGLVVLDGQWNHFRMELDFATDVYRTYMNGGLIATTHFVDDVAGTELNTFSDADLSALAVAAAGGTGQAGADFAWVDNFRVVDGLRGDFNSDGTVDLGDYTVWRDSLGTTGLGPAADASGNGIVDQADYAIWKADFGLSSLLPLSGTVVPEPSSLLLGLIALSAAPALRRGGTPPANALTA